jgi:hypothetical protein
MADVVTKRQWETWVENWRWVTDAMAAKGASVRRPKVAPPVGSREKVMDRLQGVWVPPDFVDVVANYSGKVTLSWRLYADDADLSEDDLPPAAYDEVSGSDADALWDVGLVDKLKRYLDRWVAGAFPDVADPWQRSWHDKVPFLEAPNGDLLAFDLSGGTARCPVVYLSHEGDTDVHGLRLGLDFTDFMTRWSNLGCPGPEFYLVEPFYDRRQRQLRNSGPVVDRWKAWIDGAGRGAKRRTRRA